MRFSCIHIDLLWVYLALVFILINCGYISHLAISRTYIYVLINVEILLKKIHI